MKEYIKCVVWMMAGGMAMLFLRLAGRELGPASGTAFWLCLGAMAAAYVLSIVSIVKDSKDEAPDVAAEREKAVQHQEELERDSSAERSAIARLERRVWLIWSGMTALHVLTGLAAGAAGGAAAVISIGLGMFTLAPLLAFVLRIPRLVVPASGTELRRRDFPELFSLAGEVAAECGHRRRLRMFIGEQGIGVFRASGYDGMLLPSILAQFLTKAELRQVMRHEFSHLLSEETANEARWLSLIVRMDETTDVCSFCFAGLLVLLPAMGAFRERVMRYRALIERKLETEADAHSLSPEEARDAVAAIAKSALFIRFCEEDRVSAYRCFESETPRRDQVDIRMGVFEEMLAQRGGLWLEELESEQPAQFDSHPTFSQRRAAYGADGYDALAREHDGAWLAEMRKLCDAENAFLAENPEYDEQRKHQYVDRRAAMETYDRCDDPLNEMDARAIVDAAEAFFGLDTPKAVGIVRSLLEKDPQNIEPKLLLGLWLLDARDDDGLELLYQVAQNGNYTERALTEAGNYAFRRGRADQIEEYRRRAAELLQYAADFHYRLDEISMSDLRAWTMPEERLHALVEEIVRIGEGCIHTIACAAVDFQPGEDAHVFVLEYSGGDDEKREQIDLRIFEMLDRREEHYAKRDADQMPIRKLEKQIPGCVVYKKEDR